MQSLSDHDRYRSNQILNNNSNNNNNHKLNDNNILRRENNENVNTDNRCHIGRDKNNISSSLQHNNNNIEITNIDDSDDAMSLEEDEEKELNIPQQTPPSMIKQDQLLCDNQMDVENEEIDIQTNI